MTEIRWPQATEATPQLTMLPDEFERRVGRGEYRGLEFLEVRAKTIVNSVDSGGRLPFNFTINAYRGCSHACTYCFARPTHEYLGLDRGTDFDTKIVVKINAVERVLAETARWCGESIAMGTNTDPYQPAEGKYRLTRGIVEVLAKRAIPFSILTKSPLVLRDLDLLAAAASAAEVRVDFSIGTLDEAVWRETEPGTPHPKRRIDAVAKLNESGVPAGVLMGPVIPGLSDGPEQLAEVVQAAVAAGATFVGAIPLHLKPGVKEHFVAWLAAEHPELVDEYAALFAGRSFQSRGRSSLLTRRVRKLLKEHGGPVAERRMRAPEAPRSRQTQLAFDVDAAD
ncbi:MAG: radical SAM protein [Acidimicrobiia bacterium]|nr:radical SAM protein [Acidimicrobiia bacterium]